VVFWSVGVCSRWSKTVSVSKAAALGRGAQDRLVIDDVRDALPAGQLAVTHLPAGVADHRDDAIPDREPLLRHAQALRRERHQRQAGLRPGGTQRGPEHARGQRAERAHVPGTPVRVAQHHVDRGEGDAQLLRDHLRLRGQHPLPHFDLAGEYGDAAVVADHQVGVEILGIGAPGVLPEDCGGLQPDQHHDAAAGQGEELAAVQARCDLHVRPPGWRLALSTASTIL
jgi:hypothetical protein